jgi:hypothetical protein
MKNSALTAGLKAAAGRQSQQVTATVAPSATKAKTPPATVLIGGHYSPEVRRALLLVQAEPTNTGRNLKQLLGEAINDLCAKYGKPQPYSGEA